MSLPNAQVLNLFRMLLLIDPAGAKAIKEKHFPKVFTIQMNLNAPNNITSEEVKALIENSICFGEVIHIEEVK